MNHDAPPLAASAAGAALADRLRALRDTLLTGLIERDVAVRLALVAALSGEHILLLGPPGTAKSLVARRLRLAFADSTYFERLLTRFTVPEELFGPLSIKGLEDDRYERLTASYLPTASVAFLDEIFKANSAILNALLTLLNEREFDNGTRRERTPLIGVIGASNELPEGEELDALFDRFLLRLHVGPVSDAGFPSLVRLRGDGDPVVPVHLRLTGAELRDVRSAAATVDVPADVEAMLVALRDWCTAEGMSVSDRRWRKIVKLLQVSAFTNGRSAVSVWDCWLLQHCVWERPEDREKAYTWYAKRVGASADMDTSRVTKLVVAWEARLRRDQESRSQAQDAEGRLLFVDAEEGVVTGETGKSRKYRDDDERMPLFICPEHTGTSNDYYGNRLVSDRTNGLNGYTQSELDDLTLIIDGRRTPFRSWSRRSSYLSDPTSFLNEDGPLPPHMEPTRYSDAHIRDRVSQVSDITTHVAEYLAVIDDRLESLDAQVRTHLWLTEDFLQPAQTNLHAAREVVVDLQRRIEAVRVGFDALPRELHLHPPSAPPSDDPSHEPDSDDEVP